MRSIALVACLAAGAVAQGGAGPREPEAPRGVVLMIGDGLGAAALALARSYAGAPLALDGARVGAITVEPVGGAIPDSAATATALATGVNTRNGMIGVDAGLRRLVTLVEAAETAGLSTGVVTTTRLTHATPAAFTAHVPSRGLEEQIAAQQVACGAEVLLGGGARWFRSERRGGSRDDGRELMVEWAEAGGGVAVDRAGLASAQAPVLGLFAEDHMTYVIDRDDESGRVEPTLAEMTDRALDLLRDDPDGFLLVVEGGRIDHAGHENDAAALVRETLAFDEAFAVARDRAAAWGDVLVLATADHETGGLALGWAPGGHGYDDLDLDALKRARASLPRVAAALTSRGESPERVLAERLGLDAPRPDEVARVRAALGGDDVHGPGSRDDAGASVRAALTELVSLRTRVGWTTHGHTAVDVPVHAVGPGAARFAGVHPNTRIGQQVAGLLGLRVGLGPD